MIDPYYAEHKGEDIEDINDLNNVQREASNNIKSFDNRTIATNILGSKYYIVNKDNIKKEKERIYSKETIPIVYIAFSSTSIRIACPSSSLPGFATVVLPTISIEHASCT